MAGSPGHTDGLGCVEKFIGHAAQPMSPSNGGSSSRSSLLREPPEAVRPPRARTLPVLAHNGRKMSERGPAGENRRCSPAFMRPSKIQTCGLCLRRAALYPPELRAREGQCIRAGLPATVSSASSGTSDSGRTRARGRARRSSPVNDNGSSPSLTSSAWRARPRPRAQRTRSVRFAWPRFCAASRPAPAPGKQPFVNENRRARRGEPRPGGRPRRSPLPQRGDVRARIGAARAPRPAAPRARLAVGHLDRRDAVVARRDPVRRRRGRPSRCTLPLDLAFRRLILIRARYERTVSAEAGLGEGSRKSSSPRRHTTLTGAITRPSA